MPLRVTLNDITFVARSLPSSQALPSEPARVTIGRITSADRFGTYLTTVEDFSGPLGQEILAIDEPAQGYRSGALNGEMTYLILPGTPTNVINSAVVTTPYIIPGFPGAYASILPNLQVSIGSRVHQYYQLVAVGNGIWRSDQDGRTFTPGSNPVTSFTDDGGATQVTSIVRLKQPAKLQAPRVYAAAASEKGDHALKYSEDVGGSWSTDANTGEAISAPLLAHDRRGTAMSVVLVGRSDGSMYRLTGGATVNTMDPMLPGRVTFLQGQAGDATLDGIWMIKGGVLMQVRWEVVTLTRMDRVSIEPEVIDLGYLLDGCLAGGAVYVTDGWNVYEVMASGDVNWVGLPPNLRGNIVEIRKLVSVSGRVVALCLDNSDNTIALAFPAVKSPIQERQQRFRQRFMWPFWMTGRQMAQPPERAWTELFSVPSVKPYGAYIGRTRPLNLHVGIGAVGGGDATLFFLGYDATNSYVYSMTVPSGTGSVPPGGDFPTTASRVMPSFDGGMPDVTGAFFGVVVLWSFPENSGSIGIGYNTSPSDDPTFTALTTTNSTGADSASNAVEGSVQGAVRGASVIKLNTPASFQLLDLELTINRGTTTTMSPRILGIGYIWAKREELRYTFKIVIDAAEYMRREAKGYDGLMADIKTLYDSPTPVTLAIEGIATTYSVRLVGPAPALDMAYLPNRVGELVLSCETVG